MALGNNTIGDGRLFKDKISLSDILIAIMRIQRKNTAFALSITHSLDVSHQKRLRERGMTKIDAIDHLNKRGRVLELVR